MSDVHRLDEAHVERTEVAAPSTGATLDDTHYQVHEFFTSIQGEGVRAGVTSFFLRLQGCPVGCEWCDSKLTWYAGGTRMTLREIMGALDGVRAEQVVITGGEPYLYHLDALLSELHGRGRSTQIETSGAIASKGDVMPTFLTVSPKYARNFYVEPDLLANAFELKYVVDEHFIAADGPAIVREHLDGTWRGHSWRRVAGDYAPPHVVLMPEGSPPRAAMVKETLRLLHENPRWRFGPRLQYAYPEIAASEGDSNCTISQEEARERAHEHRRAGGAWSLRSDR